MHRFYARPENIHGTGVMLDLGETRHLRDVLRLRKGDTVRVFDGEGRELTCEIAEIGKKQTNLHLIEETAPPSPESSLRLTLAAAMLKGEKFDTVVQKAVELGVSRLVPLGTIRCAVKSGDSTTRLDRWRKIMLEALKQSGRATLMEISAPIEFRKFLASHKKGDGRFVLFSERGGSRLPTVGQSKGITAVVGPEGGWEDSELEAARAASVEIVTLGGRILRAETAAIAIAAILQHRFGDLH